MAIDCLKILKDKGFQNKLCMIGPKVDDTVLEAQQRVEKFQLDVEFTGKLTRDQWISKATDYNIFLNTTNVDNMPMSVIEAMALGLPVISTNVGGMPYLIEHEVDGLLVEPNNPEAMASAIERLMQEPQLRSKIIRNARKKVEQFDWNVIRHQWLEILKP